MDKKLLLISGAVAFILILFLGIQLFLGYQNTKSKGEIEERLITENYLTMNELKKCGEDCDSFIFERLATGIKEKAAAAQVTVRLEDDLQTINNDLNNKDYSAALKNIERISNAVDETIRTRRGEINTNQVRDAIRTALKEGVEIEGYRIVNFQKINNYLVASLIPEGDLTDKANVILISNGSTYKLVSGPATFFDESTQEDGIPASVINLANNF